MNDTSTPEAPDGVDHATSPDTDKKPPRPLPKLRGRLVGSLPGSAAGAASIAVLRHDHSGDVIGQSPIAGDGSFEIADLPQALRGRSFTVEIVTADKGGSATAITAPINIPLTGDASAIVDRGMFGSDAGSLSPSPEVLDPTRFDELLKGHEASTGAFAGARKAAIKRHPPTDVDWVGAATYVASLTKGRQPGDYRIPPDKLDAFDLDTVFTKPTRGLATNPVPRIARLRLTAGEQATLQTATPTICRAVEARRDLRALERRPRLMERLNLAATIEALAIPPAPPTPPTPNPPPPPDNATVAALEREAEKAALRRAAGVISDLGPDVQAPSTATDLKRLHALAAELELAGGPANVAAAREVHTLQVAFEQPGTAMIDKDLIEAWWRLVSLRKRLQDERGIKLPDPPSAPTRDELTSYLASSRRLINDIATEPPPQLVRTAYPMLSPSQWTHLSDEARDVVVRRSAPRQPGVGTSTMQVTAKRLRGFFGDIVDTFDTIKDALDFLTGEATSEIEALLESSPSVIAEADQTLDELRDRLSGPYEFTVFVPGSVNYGLLLTYRQEWSPVRYQVGRMVDTIPLTPGERREFRIVTTRKLHENRKTVTSQSRESQRETTSTHRLESEAIEAATMAINNQISSNGSFDIGVGSIGGSTQFTQNLTSESRRTLKNFSEMARKAVDSLREQVEVTVETTTDITTEQAETRTITNPNNEIMITYLLYELERRYRVQTQLQRIRPVVLVALPMPSPDEITPAWILEHSWQIREALLDPTLREVLDELEDAQSGAAIEYEVRRAALLEQRRVAQQLVTEYESLEAAARLRQATIVGAIQGEGEAAAEEWGTGQRIAVGIVTGGVSEVFGFGSSDEDEKQEARREAAQKALEYLEKQIEAKGAAMTIAATALRQAVDRFTEAAVERRRTKLATTRLQVHLRDHIFHYMHAIWAATHPDHRFFDLYDDEVPFHEPNPADYVVRPSSGTAILRNLPGIDDTGADLELVVAAPDVTAVPPKRRLADIADLDRPLGFRGNLAIFELRQCSQLTDHMAAEYLDPVSGVADPGELSGISAGELIEYLQEAIGLGLLDKQQLTRFKRVAHRLLREQRDWADELVLPTGQLFLEALRGDTTLLEPFKLVHRGLDVLAAEEDVRTKRIDALRRVRKLAQSELERDPTSVEHFYLGEIPNVVATDGDGSGPGGGS
jgi:hypothetical protein